jgi:hypothetical protein
MRPCFAVDPAADAETIAIAIKPEAKNAIDTRRTAICQSIGGVGEYLRAVSRRGDRKART